MKWFYNRIYRKDKGFTLVELMVVIIILAVLTGIAIPSYMALRNRARVQATRSEMQNIATALEVFNADNDAYPTTAEGLAAVEAGDYMASVPDTDAWGGAYTYTSADGTTYTLNSNAGSDAATDIEIVDGQFTDEIAEEEE